MTKGTAVRKPWYERLKEDDPEYYARIFADSTQEEFLARVAARERHGIPAKCEDVPTLLRVARIFST